MKNIIKYSTLLFVLLTLVSCKDFLEWPQSSTLDEEVALSRPEDIESSLVGAYAVLDNVAFWGRNAIALPDMLGDIVTLSSNNSGWLLAFSDYTFNEGTGDIAGIWANGYAIIDRCAKTITGGKKLLNNGKVYRVEEKELIHKSLASAYALKAFAQFYLVNVFAVPYTVDPNSIGLVVVGDNPIVPNTPISRSTVAQTYAQIESDIASAKAEYALSAAADYPSANVKYWANEGAVYAIEARVKLYKEEWAAAISAATTALAKSSATVNTNNTTYISGWSSTGNTTTEDIWTCNFSATTKLSASSMSGLYSNYGGVVKKKLVQTLLNSRDIRNKLYTANSSMDYKSKKYPNADGLGNVPIFRASEMALIQAESYAQLEQVGQARTALFRVARRDSAITSESALPSTKGSLLTFIADERARELVMEGHRWFDLRRTKTAMSRTTADGETRVTFTNFAVCNCMLPIPNSEITASHIQQNDWISKMPTQ
jgi:hypothetical protein